MLQTLAPNAMKAYKRKKLTFFPSAAMNNSNQEGHAEMELDSGDEVPDFPSVPPLPDEAPPAPQPPPPPPKEPPPLPLDPPPLPKDPPPPPLPPLPPSPPPPESPTPKSSPSSDLITIDEDDGSTADEKTEFDKSADDVMIIDDKLEVIVLDVTGTDENNDNVQDVSLVSSERDSPNLDYLEEKRRKLLDALEGEVTSADISIEIEDKTEKETDRQLESGDKVAEKDTVEDKSVASNKKTDLMASAPSKATKINDLKSSASTNNDSDVKTPESKAGYVKATSYGTPVMNVVSPYVKLPTDDKFSKDICDVINFENLPNSTGKYKQISTLLKKVKDEVDRIQDS